MAADTGSNPESQRSLAAIPATGREPTLADVLDAGKVQPLMDDFYKLTQISIGIVDLSGRVLVATGWQDICTRFHRVHPESCKHCIESDTLLSSGVQPGEHKLYKCRNNLWDMATPLVIGDLHIGNLFLGQFFFDDEAVNCELFRNQARQYGFDEDAYLEALDRVPRWPREKVSNAFNFFTRLAVVIAQLGHSNLSLVRSLADRDQLLTVYKAGEQKFRSYIDNAPYGIFIANHDGRYMEVNTTAVRLSGYDQDELLAMGTERIVAPECHAQAAAHIRAVLEKHFAADELACITKDGRHRWWAVTSVRLSDDRLLTYTEDITERRQAERSQMESLQELKRWHAATINREGRVLELKREVNELLTRSGQPVRYPSATIG